MQATNTAFTDHVQTAAVSSWLETRLLPLIFKAVGRVPVRLVIGKGPGVSPPNVVP